MSAVVSIQYAVYKSVVVVDSADRPPVRLPTPSPSSLERTDTVELSVRAKLLLAQARIELSVIDELHAQLAAYRRGASHLIGADVGDYLKAGYGATILGSDG